jgi:hypothetical protein
LFKMTRRRKNCCTHLNSSLKCTCDYCDECSCNNFESNLSNENVNKPLSKIIHHRSSPKRKKERSNYSNRSYRNAQNDIGINTTEINDTTNESVNNLKKLTN